MSEPTLSPKNMFLYTLIVSVGASTILGILAILIGEFGDRETRILITSLTISAASLCGLCCSAASEGKRAIRLPMLGMGLALVGAVMLISGIWIDVRSDEFWKTTANVSVFAIGSAHMCVLLLARLARRYEWAIWGAYAVLFVLGAIITMMLWGELHDDLIFRLLGVDAILVGAISILIPILHRLSRDETMPLNRDEQSTIADLDDKIAVLRQRICELEDQKLQLRIK